jgi:hypothetical protein
MGRTPPGEGGGVGSPAGEGAGRTPLGEGTGRGDLVPPPGGMTPVGVTGSVPLGGSLLGRLLVPVPGGGITPPYGLIMI